MTTAAPDSGKVGRMGCDQCDHGWRSLTDQFIDAEIARRLREYPDLNEPVARAALANTVYPCKACQPVQFFRWAGAHWNSDHDPGTCDECRALLPSVGARRRRSPAPGRMEVEKQPVPNTDPGPTPPPVDEEF